ncbi:MAG: response regulator [Planctomycetota bacterium]
MEARTVLFVDDDETVLKDLEMSLEAEPYEKYFAKSGEKAIEILRRHMVHVIVVDMVMPRMDGLELLRIVRQEYPHMVSVVLSGYAQTSYVARAMMELDIDDYIAKPWIFDEGFRAVVRRAIDKYNLKSERKDTVPQSKACSATQRHPEELHAE